MAISRYLSSGLWKTLRSTRNYFKDIMIYVTDVSCVNCCFLFTMKGILLELYKNGEAKTEQTVMKLLGFTWFAWRMSTVG